ncbi:MAG: glycosyltransferase family 2 protein [Dongiaceae bacterium]
MADQQHVERQPVEIMNKHGQTLCLSMIVRNEAGIITRCLSSVLPLIDHWVIVDTGSEDGTQQVVRDFMRGVPGELHQRPWVDFATNRTEALALARPHGDYTLVIDADDRLIVEPGFELPLLDRDSYSLIIDSNGVDYHRTQILRSAAGWRYRGVLHEFPWTDKPDPTAGLLQGLRLGRGTDGARAKDPDRFRRDAATIETALRTERDPHLVARYRFYLAQSYRDGGEREKAIESYRIRAGLGFWNEEVFVSLLTVARMRQSMGHPVDEILHDLEQATAACPTRAEALYAASRLCRDHRRSVEGVEYARRGLAVPMPNGGLFIERWIYEYGLLDEFAVNAYWAGLHDESLDASLRLIQGGKLPAEMLPRVAANARFAADRLRPPPKPNLGSLGAIDMVGQHALAAERTLHSRIDEPPVVLLAILAKQKEPALPLYLRCIEALDYPKSRISLWIRTNNNTDGTERILRDWVARVGPLYRSVELDATDVAERVEQYREHEWNAVRFKVLGRIRNASLQRALALGCDFYFVADVDNFLRPATLRELVALDLPIVGPLLRSIRPEAYYANYHAEVDANGYFASCDQYHWILARQVRGLIEIPVIHCTYLIRADVIPKLTYEDDTARHEYVVFSDSARRSGIPQYIDNRQVYGYVTFGEGDDHHVAGGVERARQLIEAVADAPVLSPGEDGAGRPAELPKYVVNLDRSAARLAAFRERNAHLRLTRFPAVDGRDVDRAALIADGTITADLDYTPGALGCALSHVALWRKAVAENTAITIFEDDALATLGFDEKSRAVLATLPQDWDVIHWGYHYRPLYLWVDLEFAKAKLECYAPRFFGDDIDGFQAASLSSKAVRLAHCFGTFAYSISPKGARRLLESCLPLRRRMIPFPGAGIVNQDLGIDTAMCAAYGSMQAFVAIPPLALHDDRLASIRLESDQAGGHAARSAPTAAAAPTPARREPAPPAPARRTIRLKEHPRSAEIVSTPPDWYMAKSDSTLTSRPFRIATDENAFIRTDPPPPPGAPELVLLGDSFVEGMFSAPEHRIASRLQQILQSDRQLAVAVRNAGYGGATLLHSLNTFLNKIVPLRPAGVLLMTGMVDIDVALMKASFWTRDCWAEPIVEIGITNRSRDLDLRPARSFDDQARLLAILANAGRVLGIPVWFATTPHRQVHGGEFVEKTGMGAAAFEEQATARRAVNEAMRRVATEQGVPLFDVEAGLAARTDIFYDMFHLNAVGGEAVARSLIEHGLADALRGAVAGGSAAHGHAGLLPSGSKVPPAAADATASP